MTRWGRLTFCSFYSNSRENWFVAKDIKILCYISPSFDDKKTTFQNIAVRPPRRSNFYMFTVWSIRSTKYGNNSFASSNFKLPGDEGATVLVSCAKTVGRDRNENSEALCPFDARKQSLLHCEFFTIPQRFVVFAHIDLRVDTFPTNASSLSKP